MVTAKQDIIVLIRSQPDDASYDEILRALSLNRMVERGLEDSREGRVVSNEEIKRQIESWPITT